MDSALRQHGIVVAIHESPSKYKGTFGVILGDDGKDYVWCCRQVYRNFSHLTDGSRVSFLTTGHGTYATAIDQTDKHTPFNKTNG